VSRLPSPERTQFDAVRWSARVCAASLIFGVSCAPPQDRPPARIAPPQAAPSAVRLPAATEQPPSAAPPDLELDAGDARRPAPTLRFTLETAKQAQPTFIAPGPDASVWFVESSGRLRKVSATGTVELSTVFAKGQWLLSDAASSPTGELALIGLFNELQLGGTRVPHRKDFSDFSGLRGAFVARLDNNAKPLFVRSLPSAMRNVLAVGEKTVLAGFGGGTAKPEAPDPLERLQGFFLAGLGKDGAAQWANSTDPGQLRASGDGFTFISSSTGSHVQVSSWSQEGKQTASQRVPYKARIDHAAAHRGQVALGFEMLASSGPPDFGIGPVPRGFGFGVAQLLMAPEPAVGWIRLFDGEAPRRFQELLEMAPTPGGGTVVATLWLHAEAAELPPDTAPPAKGVAVDLELIELDDQGHLAWSLRQLLPDSCHTGLQGQDAPTTNVTADVLVTSNRAYVAVNCGMVETYAGAFGDNRAWLYGWQRAPE
jgi:hypothetical protein